MNVFGKLVKWVTIVLVGSVVLTGCAMQPTFPQPTSLVSPEPIMDNSGEFMSPYTQDGVLAEWTDKSINVSAAGNVGGAVAAYAGQRALSFIPFVGGYLGNAVGSAAARAIALEAIGGEEFLKESSDMSFNTMDDLAVHMYVNFSSNEHYADALKATQEIYPDMKQGYYQAIQRAEKCPVGGCPTQDAVDAMETQNIGNTQLIAVEPQTQANVSTTVE